MRAKSEKVPIKKSRRLNRLKLPINLKDEWQARQNLQ